MATLRISESNGVFTPSSDPMNVPKSDGQLAIKAPSDGCLICLQTAMDGQTYYYVKPETTVDLSAYPVDTTWGYDIYAYTTSSCPASLKETAAHSITITS
jgi:hypothetical protein